MCANRTYAWQIVNYYMSLDLSSVENIQDSMITVMGLGRYKKGSGVGAAKWLLRHGAQLVITDLKNEADLHDSIDEIMTWYTQYREEYKDRDIYAPVFVLGKHNEDDFTNVDMVVQNPGVVRESSLVVLAKEQGVHVESDISLFFRYCKFPIVTVTGTRGKSTTTALLGEMFKHKHPKAVVAGNITRSPLEDLDWVLEETEPVPIVLELSSWLLETLKGLGLGPSAALLTNAYKDHLDRYDSFEHYLHAKEMIFMEQDEDQYAVLNADQDIMDDIAKKIPSKKVFWFSSKKLAEGKEGVYRDGDNFVRVRDGETVAFAHAHDLKLEGDHNIMNALSASLVAHLSGVSDDDIHVTLKEFAGLPGRQEIIGEKEGIMYVNDTAAFSPEGVIAALKRFGKGGNIVLIAGGGAKGLSYEEMGTVIGEQCKFVVVFDGTAADAIEAGIGDGAPSVRVDSMKKAMEAAQKHAALGDIVLLSPGTSSFEFFENEFDRGEQFQKAYDLIKGEETDEEL
jgi:UDP-N-acetylmuramoylalanine--D-glutamate ligase